MSNSVLKSLRTHVSSCTQFGNPSRKMFPDEFILQVSVAINQMPTQVDLWPSKFDNPFPERVVGRNESFGLTTRVFRKTYWPTGFKYLTIGIYSTTKLPDPSRKTSPQRLSITDFCKKSMLIHDSRGLPLYARSPIPRVFFQGGIKQVFDKMRSTWI